RTHHLEQRRLPRLSIPPRPLGAADRMVESRDEAGALAEQVARARLHESFEHPAVDILDRRCPLAQVFERLEGTVRVAQADDALHRMPADVLDRGEAKPDSSSTPLSLTLSPLGRGELLVGHREVGA